jgi:hypothetical protein
MKSGKFAACHTLCLSKKNKAGPCVDDIPRDPA